MALFSIDCITQDSWASCSGGPELKSRVQWLTLTPCLAHFQSSFHGAWGQGVTWALPCPAPLHLAPRTCVDTWSCGDWVLFSLPRVSCICRITEPPRRLFLEKSTGSGRSPMNLRMMLHTAKAACGKGDRGLG